MNNIEENISYSPTGNNDSSDRAREIDNWNIEQATLEANQLGLEIGCEHIDVMNFLRE